MRILWICNIMLPIIAKHLNRESSVKEGWLTGLAEQVLAHGEKNGIELGISFPVEPELRGLEEHFKVRIQGKECNVSAFGFCENTARPDKYDVKLEEEFKTIFENYKPDVIHCFGTEYPHTLAAVRACPDRNRILLGIQGICFAIAKVYRADLPAKICRRFTLRDFLKGDNILLQQKKFCRRGELEKEALKLAGHVTGRTRWDRATVQEVNPNLHYHLMNETLRPIFYEGQWNPQSCRPHSIFISQGDYPIKGLHYVLWALPEILKKYPDTHVYVAGQSIIRYGTLKEKLKISSYGKYLLEQMKKLKLEEKVTFLGKLSAEEMKKQYLASHLFLCPSAVENSPNSLGEAMLLRVPCVAAAVGGIPSMMSEQEGILYEGGSTEALVQAVLSMWEDETRRKECTANARRRALCNHDADTNYHTLLKIYTDICQ